MTKKRAKTSEKWTRRKIIPLIVVFSIILLAAVYTLSLPRKPIAVSARAILMDQLSITHPNKTFYWQTQEVLNQFDLQIWYHEGIFNTVDFFTNLPSYNYRIIVLRSHSAMSVEGTLAIFTGEKWDDAKARLNYLTDIIAERIVRVRTEENSTAYFGITPAFISTMKSDFEDAIIIMMGCEGLTNQNMAKAFIEKGAKVYISWTGLVSSEHTDSATAHLLQRLFVDRKTVKEAVTATNNEIGKDPVYGSELAWYPPDEGAYVINVP